MSNNIKNPKWEMLSYDSMMKHLEEIHHILEKEYPGYELRSQTMYVSELEDKLPHYITYFHIFKSDTKIKDLKEESYKTSLDSSFIFAQIATYNINNEKSYVAELLNINPLDVLKKNKEINEEKF